YWTGRREALQPTDPTVRRLLALVDWSRYGEMRGLEAALQRILLSDQDPQHVIGSLARIDLTSPDSAIGPDTTLIARPLARDKSEMIHTVDGSDVSDLLQRIVAQPRRYASVVVCSPYIDRAFVPHLIDLADNTRRAQCGLRIVTSPATAALLRESLPGALSRT